MTEEHVTKRILKWLVDNEWKIICYDFPQSGTGILLHPNGSTEKNKDAINPDIVAVKNNNCVFFENKAYFYYPDFEKVEKLRNTANYSGAINKLLNGYNISAIWYGIGYPKSAHKRKAEESKNMTDFVVGVNTDGNIEIIFCRDNKIFI